MKRKWVEEWIEAGLIVLIAYFIVTTFIIQTFCVPSSSMEPTLQVGDMLLVYEYVYGFSVPYATKKFFPRNPERGDIVVFLRPLNAFEKFFEKPSLFKAKYCIKRTVGLPGEILEISDGKTCINNRLLDEPYVLYSTKDSLPIHSIHYGPIKIPSHSYFVMGDNREASYDSRIWDSLNEKYIRGKALRIYWPRSRSGLIKCE